jgi:hypothetical protein
MKFIFTILFIALLIFSLFSYFYYNNKIIMIRKQLLLNTKQYESLKRKYKNIKVDNIVSVKYYVPAYKTGVISNNTQLHIAPLDNSQVLRNIAPNTKVSILDSSEVNNEVWYYINLPIKSNINCRGWISSKNFNIFSEEIYYDK